MFASTLGTLTADELKSMCVALKDCVSVALGEVDSSAVSILESRGYDQAPVYDADQRSLFGLVETRRLRMLVEQRAPLTPGDPAIQDEERWFRIGSGVAVEELLSKMTGQRAVLVVQESDATEYGHAEWGLGLLTISDLNRHALRANLYSLMSHLEAGLASLVEKAFVDSWMWIRTLNESYQVNVLGYWELSKRRGVDVGPIGATTLAQLIQVVSRSTELLGRLEFKSRTEFDTLTDYIPKLRNSVMHPVRPLILEQSDVARVRETVLAIGDLAERVRRLGTTTQTISD
jgi:hypothetical protein